MVRGDLEDSEAAFGRKILELVEVYGRGICMVIKTRGLRGEQFVSLSKQRGKNWAFIGGSILVKPCFGWAVCG